MTFLLHFKDLRQVTTGESLPAFLSSNKAVKVKYLRLVTDGQFFEELTIANIAQLVQNGFRNFSLTQTHFL